MHAELHMKWDFPTLHDCNIFKLLCFTR